MSSSLVHVDANTILFIYFFMAGYSTTEETPFFIYSPVGGWFQNYVIVYSDEIGDRKACFLYMMSFFVCSRSGMSESVGQRTSSYVTGGRRQFTAGTLFRRLLGTASFKHCQYLEPYVPQVERQGHPAPKQWNAFLRVTLRLTYSYGTGWMFIRPQLVLS